jgi:hypothetical protein
MILKKGEQDPAGMLARHNVQIIEFDDFGPPMVKAISDIADEAWGPARGFVSVPGALAGLVDALAVHLRAAAPDPAVVGRAFNRWRPRPLLEPVALGGDGIALALEAAGTLANATRQQAGYFPLLEFVREVAQHCRPLAAEALARWLEAAAAALGADDDDAARLLATRFTPPDADLGADHYVLVRLEAVGQDKWRVQSWLFSGREPWKLFPNEQEWERGSFPDLLSVLLDRVSALELDPEHTTVAFMVPRALMVEAIDLLEPAVEFARQPSIGVTLPVTVRSLERLRLPRNLKQLDANWRTFKAAGTTSWPLDDTVPSQNPGAAIWLRPSDAGPALIVRLQKHGVNCVVLSAPPTSQSNAATDLFNCVLQAAVPAVVWLREPAAADPAAARQALAALLGDATRALPQRVWQLRQEAAGDPAHAGQCVVLLWDDADRLPPDQDLDNRAVVPRG